MLYTEGAQHVAESGGAYWLLDEIAFAQSIGEVAAEAFQVWKLKVNPDHTATLECDDGNSNNRFSKRIEFTDFPLDEVSFYFADSVIMLPSEYYPGSLSAQGNLGGLTLPIQNRFTPPPLQFIFGCANGCYRFGKPLELQRLKILRR